MQPIKEFTTQPKVNRRVCSFILVLVLVAAMPLTGWASPLEELQLGILSTLTTSLQPLNPTEKDMASIYSVVYEGLVELDDDLMPQPKLAESWERSGGGNQWTFTIRNNVKFSDGTPMNAYDVEATLKHILAKASDEMATDKGYYANVAYYVKGVDVEDERTLIITASRSSYAFLYAMTFPILPKDQLEYENPPGTGPYMITGFTPQESLFLEVNPNWWKQPPEIKYIICHLHPSDKELLLSYENMRVDAIFTRSVSAAQYGTNTANSISIPYRTNQLEVLLVNNKVPEFEDLKVRQALRHVINANQIASQIYMGMAQRTDTPMPSGTWMHNEDGLKTYEYNIQKAQELLAEAGWKDSDEDSILDKPKADGTGLRNFKVRLLVYDETGNTLRSDTALMVKKMLADVNIDVYDIQYTPFQNMAEKLKAGSFDLALVAYQMDDIPDPGFLLMSGNVGNYVGYRNNEMDELFKSLRKTPDFESYQRVLFDIQKKFSEDIPFIPLFYRSGAILTRNMFTTARVRELGLLKGIENYKSTN